MSDDRLLVPYGVKVSFQQDSPIKFADFILTFAGDRIIKPPHYPRGIRYRDFMITGDSNAFNISWSTGTGDICPSAFTIADKRFSLSLSISDQLGVLQDNELVVTLIHPVA
mgnify:FL=1